jgi:multidrug transporter EmrE-like cation transporter
MNNGFAFIFAGVILNAIAQLLLKAGTNAVGQFDLAAANLAPVATRLAFEPHILGGMVCYGVSLVVWLIGLSRIEVSVAYPMLSLGYVLNAAAAWYWFGEAIGPMRIAGIGAIILGVCLVARSS